MNGQNIDKQKETSTVLTMFPGLAPMMKKNAVQPIVAILNNPKISPGNSNPLPGEAISKTTTNKRCMN